MELVQSDRSSVSNIPERGNWGACLTKPPGTS